MMEHTPIAVIDVGTNTFHLLIARPDGAGQFEEIFRERRFIKLAQDGINFIGQAPYHRALDTMRDFRQIIDEHGVEQIRAFGTAALRTASNGPDLKRDILEQTGIPIELINGEQEAHYILRGVRLALPLGQEPALIMDIGGGSVEFLIANDTQTFWMQSFPIGVAVLFRNFHRHEPIEAREIAALREFLEQELAPLQEALKKYPAHRLIGVAGTFDVLENLLEGYTRTGTYATFSLKGFPELLQRIVQAPIEERLRMEGIPRYRADMIVVALILIDVVLQLNGFRDIQVSHYDLKEGILGELMEHSAPV